MKNKNTAHPLFSFKKLPMDVARIVSAVLIPIFRIKRINTNGEKYTKKIKGGAIIAANHTSFADPFIVGITFWYRRMHFLIAEIVMQGKLRSLLLKGIGGIRIDRNLADIEAINKSITKLKEGYLLTIFPQGGINKDDDIDNVKSGAVLMAIRANAPIIPMYIVPKNKWYKRKLVIIGETIYPSDICQSKFPTTKDINAVTDRLVSELNKCKSANYNIMEK